MGYTYPQRHKEGAVSAEELQLLLKSKTIIARRLADLTKEKFLADYLLAGRYDATGGGVFYETDTEDLYTDEDPEAIEPGGEYPLITLDEGVPSGARTVKWGQGIIFTDEKITREGRQYVEKGLRRIGNTIIRHTDRAAWGVIASRVTSTHAASAAWTTAGIIMRDILTIQNERANLATGLELDVVALSGAQFAKLIGILVDDKALPREQANIVLTGSIPVSAYGVTWLTSQHITGTDPWLFDVDQLGGMADEKLISPEFAPAGNTGVEASSTRASQGEKDGHLVRGRRNTVAVVTEPLAGVRITGTGL
ncbi:phage major capsid protein [Microbacterium resistens]|uniref:phage major capsid protein n=1 Tax=Microbacterium resistens TaxID=156977 RepID=UPI003671AA4A